MSISVAITETVQAVAVTVNDTTQAVTIAVTEAAADVSFTVAEYGNMFKAIYDPANKSAQIMTTTDDIDCGTIT